MFRLGININQIRADVRNIRNALGFIFKCDRKRCLLKFGLIVVQSLLPLAMLYILKLLVDGVTGGTASELSENFSKIWFYAGLFCSVFLFNRLMYIINQYLEEILLQKLIDFVCRLIHEKSVELDMAYYDNPEYYDTFHRAQQEAGYRPVQIINNISGLIASSISLIGIIIILIAFSWWVVVVLVLAGLPALWARLSKYRDLYQWRKANTALFREADYFSTLITHRRFAKEIRVFNLGSYLLEKYNGIREGIVKAVLQISRRRAKSEFFSAFIETIALIFIIILLGSKSIAGAITVGSFVMYFEAFRRGQGFVQGILSDISSLYNNKLFLRNLFDFLELRPQIKSSEKPISFPSRIKHGILFDNVSFAYPDSDKRVIQNLTFNAKPGEITLIQGENGSGKTTLLKLLCRMYECTSGNIYIDGINIKNFSLLELQKNISVIFQDFAQFDLTVRENITLGNINDKNNIERLKYASRFSCAESVINQLPLQYDTILGKYFETGEELSIGQWQRVALGRALYNNAPVLALDEPTSWMDKTSKTTFYKNLEKIKDDKVILLVNHFAKKELVHPKKNHAQDYIITNN